MFRFTLSQPSSPVQIYSTDNVSHFQSYFLHARVILQRRGPLNDLAAVLAAASASGSLTALRCCSSRRRCKFPERSRFSSRGWAITRAAVPPWWRNVKSREIRAHTSRRGVRVLHSRFQARSLCHTCSLARLIAGTKVSAPRRTAIFASRRKNLAARRRTGVCVARISPKRLGQPYFCPFLHVAPWKRGITGLSSTRGASFECRERERAHGEHIRFCFYYFINDAYDKMQLRRLPRRFSPR